MKFGMLLAARRGMGHPSKKLIASYVLDWVVIIAFAVAGAIFSIIEPHHRPFTLLNPEISYPYVEEQITMWMLGVVAFLVPALLIAIITICFVPGKEVRSVSTSAQVWKLKLWELEKGLAGLCFSVAVAFFVTQGMKNMFGKPRPNMLARCEPDLSSIQDHIVGGYGQDISIRWTLVDIGICQSEDETKLNDGFRSFPSGHSSWSWSGLLYLTLYFCSKFAIGLPSLPVVQQPSTRQKRSSDHELLPLRSNRARGDSEDTKQEYEDQNSPADAISTSPLWVRNSAAAPPNYLIIPALTPVAVAVYVCSTRWAEYYHFGFDIIGGSLIGIVTAWLAFRWYHQPIGSRGQGWAWGSRSRDRAFAIGVGTGGYVGDEGWHSAKAPAGDVEMAHRS
ncbi:hypothetical protein AC578_577 [Pseudocercospora eumusae]|uniref:Phosphatidic acid phosphatase type 2/haloperoxidase domain-containing protein n=1 Tax=Pseudocercospora eumusae TaxID=321146 RepID=A0A139HYC6_9PEZI|nr:hypothetical protein AC578_577 [Pseudocercospora eumusae]